MDARHTEPKVVVLCCAVWVGGLGECVGGAPLGCLFGAPGVRLLMFGSSWHVRCLFPSVSPNSQLGTSG